MLCCLVGGLLAAALVRAARRRRAHNPLLALAFGFGAGALVVEFVITLLVPLGSVKATGPLPARLAFLILPAVLAVTAGLAGAAGSLLSRLGVITVASAAGHWQPRELICTSPTSTRRSAWWPEWPSTRRGWSS